MSIILSDFLLKVIEALLFLVSILFVTEAFAQLVEGAAFHDAEERLDLAIRVIEVLAQFRPSPVTVIEFVDVALSELLVEQAVEKVVVGFLALPAVILQVE